MPSPLGHALAGVIAGRLVSRAARPGAPGRVVPGARSPKPGAVSSVPGARSLKPGAVSSSWPFALLGVVPDVDLLFGTHSTCTHSVGAVLAIAVAAAAWGLWGRRPPGRAAWWVLALAAGAAYGSHLLLDWLGTDTSPPFGIMALWPFSHEFYKAPVSWFLPVSRDVWSPEFWTGTTLAAATELLLFGPFAWLAHRGRVTRA